MTWSAPSVQAMTAVSMAIWIPSKYVCEWLFWVMSEIFAELNLVDSESIIADAKPS